MIIKSELTKEIWDCLYNGKVLILIYKCLYMIYNIKLYRTISLLTWSKAKGIGESSCILETKFLLIIYKSLAFFKVSTLNNCNYPGTPGKQTTSKIGDNGRI